MAKSTIYSGDIVENKITGKRLKVWKVLDNGDGTFTLALYDIRTNILDRYIEQKGFNNWKVVSR